MTLKIIRKQPDHIEAAAELVAERFGELRRGVPLLPERYEQTEVLAGLLGEIDENAPGAAAFEGGRLVGFLSGFIVPNLFGRRSFYSPEWANAAETVHSAAIYERLYEHIAPEWVANGCRGHCLSLMSHDRLAWDAWYWLGFGMTNVDGLRPLDPLPDVNPGVQIRRAGASDSGVVGELLDGLLAHMAGPAAFYRHVMEDPQVQLSDPQKRFWLALLDGQAVGLMGLQSNYSDACLILQDDATIQLEPAYVRPEARGRGVALALLDHCLAVASGDGFRRCAVDFESANIQARRFWLRYFEPVCYSMARFIDERLVD